MLALIQFFIELSLLRRAPQDLPASGPLMGLALVADVLVGVLLAVSARLTLGEALAQGLVDVALMLGLLYAALYLTGRVARFLQSATGLLGAGAVLGVVAVVPLGLLPADGEGGQSVLAGLLFLGLIGWSLLVTGHILRHTFDLTLAQGAGIAVVYNLFAFSLMSSLFSGS